FVGTTTQAQKLLKEYYPNGQVKLEGIKLENNLEHGLWIKYYENGQIEMELSYKEGVKHGPFISYLENGNIESMGTYRNDKLDGMVVFFNEFTQKIETVGKMKQGSQIGT
ncbi:MAG TPA: hypothetical protein DCM08_10675, partial [Microscillaceae bacterium]|nr:hypothetical protein [Microscillaceae bacterium]